MSSKQKQIPAIRFEGFTDAWEQRELGELATKIGSGKTPRGGSSVYTQSGIPLLRSQNIYDDKVSFEDVAFINDSTDEDMANSRVNRGDVLLNITGASIGRSAVYELSATANVNQHVCIIRPSSNVHSYFIQLNLASSEGQKQIELNQAGGGREGLNFQQIAKMSFYYPSLEEQIKLGVFFQQLNKTIALHQRQLDNCKQLKSSMMQKIFNQELRFKDENGKDYPEWQKYDLSEIVDRVTRKNTGLISELPLTISAQYGLVDQLTFFNKTIAGVNLEAYYLLKNGEFAYNKSYSSGYPLGAIKRLDKYDAGLLSTLYICFSPRNNVDSDFLTQYFESTKWHKQIVNISGEGARNHGLLNIAVGDFFSTEHILPCKEEQQRIANLLYSLDKMIDLSKRKVESLNEQKKGLVRLMFV